MVEKQHECTESGSNVELLLTEVLNSGVMRTGEGDGQVHTFLSKKA